MDYSPQDMLDPDLHVEIRGSVSRKTYNDLCSAAEKEFRVRFINNISDSGITVLRKEKKRARRR